MERSAPAPGVELIFAADCPNVDLARTNLSQALEQVGLSQSWAEHLIGNPDAPAHVQGFGSPTILIDRREVTGAVPSAEASCRIYASGTSWARAPSVAQIAAALRSRMSP
jgi:hypothetical protein